jgi:hypothetical protein
MDWTRSAISTPVGVFGCRRTVRTLVLLSAGTLRAPVVSHPSTFASTNPGVGTLPPQEGLQRYLLQKQVLFTATLREKSQRSSGRSGFGPGILPVTPKTGPVRSLQGRAEACEVVRILTTQQIFHRIRTEDGYCSCHGLVRISRQMARANGQTAAFSVPFRILP